VESYISSVGCIGLMTFEERQAKREKGLAIKGEKTKIFLQIAKGRI
jgi:hypothetical protein